MNRVDPMQDALTATTREICRDFATLHLPDEAEMTDIVWDAFMATLGIQSITELTAPVILDLHARPVHHLGAIGEGGRGSLDCLAAFGALATVAALASARTKAQSLEVHDLKSMLETETNREGFPTYLREPVMTSGVDFVEDLLERTASKVTAQQDTPARHAESSDHGGNVRVTWKHNEGLLCKAVGSYADAAEILQEGIFNFVIDEAYEKVIITDSPNPQSRPREWKLDAWSGMLGVVLWLLLTHVGHELPGRNQFSKEDLEKVRRPPIVKRRIAAATFQSYIRNFNARLGQAYAGLLTPNGPTQYKVDSHSVSLCWIRLSDIADERESQLLPAKSRPSWHK